LKTERTFQGAGGSITLTVHGALEAPEVVERNLTDLEFFKEPCVSLLVRSSTMRHAVKLLLSKDTALALANALLEIDGSKADGP